jgi:HK97 gp10 family phage protein
VKFIDHSDEVLALVEANKKRALKAMGVTAEGLVVKKMQSGYGSPIRQTGDLMRDVNHEVEASGKDTVDVGNSLKYAPFVHEGTRRMKGRPYIKDGITGGKGKLEDVATREMKKGF